MKIYELNLREISFANIARFFFAFFLISFPFQLKSLLFDSTLHITGALNHYGVFFLHLSDLLLILALFFFGIAYYRDEIKQVETGDNVMLVLLLMFVATLFVSVFFAVYKYDSFLYLLNGLPLLIAYFLIVNELLTLKKIVIFLGLGLAGQVIMAVLQFITQSSLGLRIIGEPYLNLVTKGIAKINYEGGSLLRAYGTFSHPNVLGGALVIIFWLAAMFIKERPWIIISFLLFSIVGLLFTFSRSAIIALIGSSLMFYAITNKKVNWRYPAVIVSIALFVIVVFNLESIYFKRIFIPIDNSITERIEYIDISKEIIKTKPFGIGPGNFTQVMQDFTKEKLFPWQMQPVHNLFLLVLNEAGIVAFSILIVLFYYLFFTLLNIGRLWKGEARNKSLFFMAVLSTIFIISLFDHYFWTTYQGRVLIVIYIGLLSSFFSKFKLPARKS
jgi:O-antigen ligase